MKPLLALLASAVCAPGANPYLHLPDDKPVTREFVETRWDANGKKSEPVKAFVTMQRDGSEFFQGPKYEDPRYKISVKSQIYGNYSFYLTARSRDEIEEDNDYSLRVIDKLSVWMKPDKRISGLYGGSCEWDIHKKRGLFRHASATIVGHKFYLLREGVGIIALGNRKQGDYRGNRKDDLAYSCVLKGQPTRTTNNFWSYLLGEAEIKTVPVKNTPNGHRPEIYHPLSQ